MDVYRDNSRKGAAVNNDEMRDPDQAVLPFLEEPKTKKTAIDLFAGCGGFSEGVSQAGFDVRAAVEFDPGAAQTYKRNHHGTAMIQKDIRGLTGAQLLRAARLGPGELDFLFGGPPCQGFTTVNVNRGIDDPRSKLMHEFIRMTKEIMPKIFMIENVPGLLSFKDFVFLLMKTLEDIGYTVRLLMLDCVSYGVPQHRKRILIQGHRLDLKSIPSYPAPTHFDPDIDKKFKGKFPPSSLATKCFAYNGFAKEEIRDLFWNNVLWIQMSKKTAGDVFERATNMLLFETIKNHVKKSSHNL
jgi:DNA-cytosine methyltransferase